METRKVQQLGPSTLAMTLPAEWARTYDVEKGDEVSLRIGDQGSITVLPGSIDSGESTATIDASDLDADTLERAIVAQYVLGRRVIAVESGDRATLDGEHISAVYNAEAQLMGLGVIEETPDRISIRCSVDPADFSLTNLLERLESTGRTMRSEAIDALSQGNRELADRALNRERQANKIFVLLLRLIFSAHRDPTLARAVGLTESFPLIAYRSLAKNLELTADSAEDIATIARDADGHTLAVSDSTMKQIRAFNDHVDKISEQAIQAAVERDHGVTTDVRERFQAIDDQVQDIFDGLEELPNDDLLQVREVLVALQQTADFGVRNAEIATNLALDRDAGPVQIDDAANE
ncbi:phosphate signaling complex PhoU family protein [Halococcoides cellulosivorans]|uniref:Histidine kinase n=1 Tax=Halococcoides cellulosivorans TaxID=1679096 RepID=A0A2R4WYR7_9EURY|nr:phosphate uptake regulator PhoU [Halococcoides cellulosivorans]AWB26675.1 histidine kinase [Halococcoides cellulosivorans]